MLMHHAHNSVDNTGTCSNVDACLCRTGQYQTSNRLCLALTECSHPWEFELAPPTALSDRRCQTLTTCNVMQWQTRAATPSSDRQCGWLSTCTLDEYEFTAPTAISDRVCKPISECHTVDQFELSPLVTSAKFVTQEWGRCKNVIKTSAECAAAAVVTKTKDVTVEDDHQSWGVSWDVRTCCLLACLLLPLLLLLLLLLLTHTISCPWLPRCP